MKNTAWDKIRSVHATKTNIPPRIVDLIAVKDILSLCVRGKSVTVICDRLTMEESYVREVLKEFVDFYGFENSLLFNPNTIFRTTKQNFTKFTDFIQRLSPNVNDNEVAEYFKICLMYNQIEKELSDYGY